jgi:predicted DNA-binding transcriptional regulator AlpA
MLLLTQREAALALRLSERTLERLRVQGVGPRYVKLKKRVLYQQSELDRWIAARVVRSTSEAISEAGEAWL